MRDITRGRTRRERRLTLAFREPRMIDRPCSSDCGQTRLVSTETGPIVCGDCVRKELGEPEIGRKRPPMQIQRFDDLLRDLTLDSESAERVRHLFARTTPAAPPRVVAPACLLEGVVYALAPPASHAEVLQHMAAKRLYGGEAGFLLDNGQFASRRDAARVAARSGQVKVASRIDSLQSGDLWK